jgi:flagellar protein FlbB
MMAEYSTVGAGARIALLLLLVLVLVVGGLVWFDYLGLLKADRVVSPVLRLVGISRPAPVTDAEDPLLLEAERMKAREEAVALRAAELDERESALRQREAEVGAMTASLAEQRQGLEQQQKSISDSRKSYDDRVANLRDLSGKLASMRPEDAVAVLEQMKDVDIIDVIRMTDVIASEEGTLSITSKWLSDLPEQRAAVIGQKMMLGQP